MPEPVLLIAVVPTTFEEMVNVFPAGTATVPVRSVIGAPAISALSRTVTLAKLVEVAV